MVEEQTVRSVRMADRICRATKKSYGRSRPILIAVAVAGIAMLHARTAAAQGDVSGVWLPIADLAENWTEERLHLTDDGSAALTSYDSSRHDSALFCMPLGTPRNMLTTATQPIEILQRPEQITVIFDGRGDVRRIFLDGRQHPTDPVPNWMGHSIGTWDGAALSVDTIAMTSESRLNDSGLPHSADARVAETWDIVERDGEALLRVSIRIEDPVTYAEPIEAIRYFRRAQYVPLRETAADCQLDQWRRYLEQHSKDLSMQLGDIDGASTQEATQ